MRFFSSNALAALFILLPLRLAGGQQQVRIESFAPQGVVKNVRQVQVRFSEAMVPLGDPRESPAPFDIECSEKGTGRWVDSRNWVYDFERDLPAGVRAVYQLRSGTRTLAGSALTGTTRFSFSTGGPSILASVPYEGTEQIDEEQVFVLELDAQPTEASVLSSVSFAVAGIASRVGMRIITGDARAEILKTHYRYRRETNIPLLLVQAVQRFPAGARISLIWGRGVATASGVTSTNDQILPFVVRTPFTATFSCQRENPQAKCIPITSMFVRFSAPIAWSDARKAVLRGPEGRQWTPQPPRSEDEESMVHQVEFRGPFPERTDFRIEIPAGLRDDAGRPLSNASAYPLAVQTDEYPPLAKFAADFGILELRANPALPVTLRNVEASVAARMMEIAAGRPTITEGREIDTSGDVTTRMQGKIFRVPPDRPSQILFWMKKLKQRKWEDREASIFNEAALAQSRSFSIPKLHGVKPFEVVGIPLKDPGFYVVEIESEILGAALLGQPKPMFVPTAALVTNLAVHFKWGIESSLVWVTALDSSRGVPGAKVQVRDCKGGLVWEGTTDSSGLARIEKLPQDQELPTCSYDSFDQGLFVTAQLKDDLAFVHTSWDEGIESWRFGVPTEYERSLASSHTVFDRTLFRAGETAHMKHFLRRRVTGGFAPAGSGEVPSTVVVEHVGSDQKYELPVRWDSNGTAETTWAIPRETRLGDYSVYFKRPSTGDSDLRLYSGNFRVEEFRVPLMRGVVRGPSTPPVAPREIAVDLSVSYLAGGGAGSLPVRFRHQIHPRWIAAPEDYEEFTFSNGRVREEIVRGSEEQTQAPPEIKSLELTLDKTGSSRAVISGLDRPDRPQEIWAELEFQDPNGEAQTVSSRIPIWESSRMIGIRPDSWALSREAMKFRVAVLDLSGSPVAGAPVRVDSFQRKTYSHRKRLVGGFYAYEHLTETKKHSTVCEGKTDRRGLLLCSIVSPISGNVILEASTADSSGKETRVNGQVWIAGKDEWWFKAENDDRIDVLPEKKRYEPGEKARFQVRMPFRRATALVTVEREGIGETFVRELSGREPVIEVPVRGSYAPNAFVSVLVLRGRVSGAQPTALVDLGRPAYKLGIAEIQVGWRAHELKVSVSADRPTYKVREKARVTLAVKTADGGLPPRGAEAALAAVDEGLLELMPNASWKLLEAMMGRRRYGVRTSTAQMHVIGKRHFGLKALPQGGGGGKQITRELFDTLLYWSARVPLDARGMASVEIPLNDSITSFRIVAVASAGFSLFGTGSATIQSTQDLMIFSGIAPVVREGDRLRSVFTLRNATEKPMQVEVSGTSSAPGQALRPAAIRLSGGESREVGWPVSVPLGVTALKYEINAKTDSTASDRLSVSQKVSPAVPVRALQATLLQLEREAITVVERPRDALPSSGGLRLLLKPTLLGGLEGVRDYMRGYPYTCFEQEVSRAVSLRNHADWKALMEMLPSYLDSAGLVKYFPRMIAGSETLTSYLITIAYEAGWEIPKGLESRMRDGLQGFVEGKVIRWSSLPTADLTIRKLTAIEALSRIGPINPGWLSTLTLEPILWPTSAVLDWYNILQRSPAVRGRAERMQESEQILRSRLNLQGTALGFSTENRDFLWWLMVSTDGNALRTILTFLEKPEWRQDIPRMVRGALGRQRRARWDTTPANAWGVLAMEKFSAAYEKTAVTGTTSASLSGRAQSVDWSADPKGKTLDFSWPNQRSELAVRSSGTGNPWLTIQSLAAVPLKQPFSSGYRLKKTVTPLEQKVAGSWSKGDIARVRLEIDAQADMTWVVVSDPIPAGSSIFGTGLGRGSRLATQGESSRGYVWPVFEERSFEAFRAYYEFAPKGAWMMEYTIRLNSEGLFQLPPTRVEAMYSPEMLGEIPNAPFEVKER